MMEMDKNYDPKKIETKWNSFWEENKSFSADEHSQKEPFSIVIPPPNVTGILHMGHALNNTIQDILSRTKRMQGFEVLWTPGTDHAGIATQNVVERKLHKEGTSRHKLGRDAFIEKVWEWKEEHGSYIINQLKRLGASCDWDRERFTMDEGLSDAVKECFIDLFNKKLVYKGKYIVNHCPRCMTALADDEVEHEEKAGHFFHMKYQVEGEDRFVEIATTRPETMLGDTAIAVHPKDERYLDIIGKNVILPLVNKPIPVVADDYVDREFGTGVVKITPAHDPNDFMVGERHNLPKLNVMTADGKINENAPIKYQGMDRFEARKAVIADLEEIGQLVKIEDHNHNVGHCYRCNTVVEPYLSDQWFVKMQPLAEKAIKALEDGDIRFVPKRWEKVYLNWMNNIRDWCISRQIWWGHRVPVYTNPENGKYVAARNEEEAKSLLKCDVVEQDKDVLDTWFSSWLWPFSTQGWPENTDSLKKFYPTSVLVTAPDIIFFWVARMVMAGEEFLGNAPFKDIYIHGIVRDDKGRKMSKSLGNSLDPLGIIDEFGADALRFSTILLAPIGQDVNLGNDSFKTGRNFANKIWNATRFVTMKAGEFSYDNSQAKAVNLVDRNILSRLTKLIKSVTDAIENYRLNEAAQSLYEFAWGHFCDQYVEYKKIDLYDESTDSNAVFTNMYYIIDKIVKLLHPYMPYITEEIHEIIHATKENSVALKDWPTVIEEFIDEDAENSVELISNIISAIRNMKSEKNIAPTQKVDIVVSAENEAVKNMLIENAVYIIKLAKVENFTVEVAITKPENSVVTVAGKNEIFMLLSGLVDTEAEKEKLEKEITRLSGMIKGSEAKLTNPSFVDKAPEKVVNIEKEKLENFKAQLALLQENLKSL